LRQRNRAAVFRKIVLVGDSTPPANALQRPGEQFRLVPCKLGDDAIALGAALLPLEQLIDGFLPTPKAAS